MRHMIRWFAVTLLLGGCAVEPWAVDSFEAPEGGLAARSAYFLKGGEIGSATTVEPGFEQKLHADVQSALRGELARKGYVEAPDRASAQFIVSYQVTGTRKVVQSDDRRIGAPSPNSVLSPSAAQPPPLSEAPRDQVVRAVTVIVFADDPASDRLLWRGLVDTQMRVGSPEEGLRIIADMSRGIAAQFPARAGQPAK